MAMFRSLRQVIPSLKFRAIPFFQATSTYGIPTIPTARMSSVPSKPGNPLHEDFTKMTNEELEDTSTIPGWDLIHSPPRKFPRGALIGTVVSTRMQKTVNVAVDRYRIVPKIRKRKRYTRKFFAHDEEEVANMGDLVMITPCHRISKHKHFMLREIIRPKQTLFGTREK
jgi:small subunit ribosomal protein S17